jgi:hypothetical protein
MSIFKFSGLRLGDLKRETMKLGYEINNVIVTLPPRESSNKYDDEFRVLRVLNFDGKKFDLIITRPLLKGVL